MEVNKRGLSALDNKRWLCDDGVHTLAFGHRDIPPDAVEVEEVLEEALGNMYDDEQVDARIPLDRAPPSPARPPSPLPVPFADVPDDAVERILYCAQNMRMRDALPPEPAAVSADDFALLVNSARDSLALANDVGTVTARVRTCVDLLERGDADAFIAALLDL